MGLLKISKDGETSYTGKEKGLELGIGERLWGFFLGIFGGGFFELF